MDLRNNLLKNAFDFLNRSVDVLEEHPKYSIIFFATSLELFIKARLAQEHWTLVIENHDTTNIDQVKSGKFNSVSLSNGIKRIENVLSENFPENQKTLFERISEHRNQIIHFYHSEFTEDSNDEMVRKALIDLSEGWYYLSYLLNKKWSSISKDYKKEIEYVDEQLDSKGHLLKGKYQSLTSSGAFKKAKESGKEIFNCKVCKYKSAISIEISQNLIRCNCPVCESKYNSIKIKCPDCEEIILTKETGEGECNNCRYEITMDELINYFTPHYDLCDPHPLPAHCTECWTLEQSVVEMGNKFVCVSCFESFDTVTACDYCSELNSGYLEYSYLSGCSACDGKLPHIMNEDK